MAMTTRRNPSLTVDEVGRRLALEEAARKDRVDAIIRAREMAFEDEFGPAVTADTWAHERRQQRAS